ncbi:MAG: hypothetical protein ACI4L2_01495 [Wujia sp.]
MGENYTDIQPLHSRAKDTFFKRVYESEERLRELAGFLLGREAEVVEIRNIRPVLYGKKRVELPFPKLYGVNVGLVNREDNLPETVTYEMRLSDSYERREGYEEQYQSIDLEAVVHIYDFRMTLQEVYLYLADLFQLLISRGVFVDLFQDKEVCDMTVAQFSRDDMLLYQGREEGLEQGREEGIRLTKSVLRLDNEGYAVSDIATELRISVEEVKRILEE